MYLLPITTQTMSIRLIQQLHGHIADGDGVIGQTPMQIESHLMKQSVLLCECLTQKITNIYHFVHCMQVRKLICPTYLQQWF